jgi:membrane-bound acyltransferase YfiQ involved in biofilm formation
MEIILGLVVLFVAFYVYFAPAIIANAKGHRNFPAIAAVNVLLGWTFLGWVVALVWALTRDAEVKI